MGVTVVNLSIIYIYYYMSINEKDIFDKINELDIKMNKIDDKLNTILLLLKKDIEPNCKKMSVHIDFIDTIYNTLTSPMNILFNRPMNILLNRPIYKPINLK